MNEYFYDKEKHALLRIDFQTGDVFVVTVFGEPKERDSSVPPPVAAKEKTAKKGRKGYACKACGEPGHNQKTCPQGAATPKKEAKPGALTADQFIYLKDSKALGQSAADVAAELHVEIREVNRAFPAADYEWYVNHR